MYFTVVKTSILKLQFFVVFNLCHFLSLPVLSSCIVLFSFLRSSFKIFLSSVYFLIKQKECDKYGRGER